MNQDKKQAKEEKAATILKEVYEDIDDKQIKNDPQISAEEAAEQVKGSDADIDRSV